jgi:hypothetical protein
MDNFYNSPALAKTLKSMGTDCVGTLKLNRKNVPKKVKETKLKKGELIGQHDGPVSVIKWHDRKIVTTMEQEPFPREEKTNRSLLAYVIITNTWEVLIRRTSCFRCIWSNAKE